MDRGVPANQEVGENTARAVIAMFSTPFRISSKSAGRKPPYCFIQVSIEMKT